MKRVESKLGVILIDGNEVNRMSTLPDNLRIIGFRA